MSSQGADICIRNAVKTHRAGRGAAFSLSVPELQLEAGCVCAVMGRSGCGKTTLLDVLGCISEFDYCEQFSFALGEKQWNLAGAGARQRALLRRGKIGYVLQQGGLLPFLTAWENIELPMRFAACPAAYRESARELAAILGIEDLLNRRPAALSIGQRQRVSIVRALAVQPGLLLADEPTGALDPISALEVKNQLLQAARWLNITTVIVTHDVELFRPVADEILGFRLEADSSGGVLSTLEKEERGDE